MALAHRATFFQCCFAPGLHYTLANTHSHSDYEQPIPFRTAYNAQFGSIDHIKQLAEYPGARWYCNSGNILTMANSPRLTPRNFFCTLPPH
jgi:hypothetical protein